jgi:hypothetical protein
MDCWITDRWSNGILHIPINPPIQKSNNPTFQQHSNTPSPSPANLCEPTPISQLSAAASPTITTSLFSASFCEFSSPYFAFNPDRAFSQQHAIFQTVTLLEISAFFLA